MNAEAFDHLDDSNPRPSRTRMKKQALALQKLGEKLTQLSEAQLTALALPADLAEAVRAAGSMRQRGALRRQMQYIGTLMRGVDAEVIREGLERLAVGNQAEVRQFKQAEQWRDQLIAGDDQTLMDLAVKFPAMDRQVLESLVQDARREKNSRKGSTAGRNLFRYIRRFMSG